MTPLVILALTAAPLPPPNPKRDPAEVLKRLEGLWEVTSCLRMNGAQVDYGARMFVRIESGVWSLQREQPDGKLQSLNRLPLVIDPKRTPGWFDFKNEASDTNLYLTGVYEWVDRNEVKVVWCSSNQPADRPKSIAASKPNEYLMTLRRAPKR
jgi:uncharacterized protein (TIGR03067 family)